MLASTQSMFSWNYLCFLAISSIKPLKCINWSHLFDFNNYSFPFSQQDSKDSKPSTNSILFFNWGSTASILVSYLLNNNLKSVYDCLICSANALTALLCCVVYFLHTYSAAHNILSSKSSLPFPSVLANVFIWLIKNINFFLIFL